MLNRIVKIDFLTVVSGLIAGFENDRQRLILWAPVAFATGIASYFALTVEPPLWTGVSLVGACGGLLWCVRKKGRLALLATGLLLASLGLLHASWKAHISTAPVLEKRLGAVELSGRIVTIEDFAKRRRILLDRVKIARLAEEYYPARVRLRILPEKPGSRALEIGEHVTLRAILMPPAAPAMPGGFDFQRKAWFEQIGAVGFAISRPSARSRGPGDSFSIKLQRLRRAIALQIKNSVAGETGAVIAALIVGDRSALTEETLQNLRDAGLAHLLAISGLHIGLVAATIFFAVRLGLALISHCALHWPIKKISAVAALLGSFVYLLIAGATVPTQRAFLTTGLVLVAILADRRAISLRLVAAAAMLVLLLRPESLLSPSFQMSFAAVIALVAFYESLGPDLWQRLGEGRWTSKLTLYFVGLALTTVIASFATGLIALHHFGRLPHFGLLGNLLAVPLTAFWIMPWAVLGVILMPFGLTSVALVPMGWGVDLVIAIAGTIAGWPQAVSLLPLMPTTGLIGVTIGGLWICLWTGRKRWLGCLGILAGLVIMNWTQKPDILISASGKLIAVRLPNNELAVSSLRREKFTAKIWSQALGVGRTSKLSAAAPEIVRCDGLACLIRTNGHKIALIKDERAFVDECGRQQILIATVPIPGYCDAALRIDRFDIWRNGAHAVWLSPGEIRVGHVRGRRGKRHWAPDLNSNK
ncbi:MAG: metal-binding protein [Rhodospirillaceae bacterium]|nr:metal-binding protein [Rhodospirillaceae bacterium]